MCQSVLGNTGLNYNNMSTAQESLTVTDEHVGQDFHHCAQEKFQTWAGKFACWCYVLKPPKTKHRIERY